MKMREHQIESAFADIPRPQRQGKPRTKGINMMIDWGLGSHAQRDVLETSSYYIDKVKVAGTLPAVLPKDVLRQKIALYKKHDIDVATGGLFAELTLKQNNYDQYLKEARAMGFTSIEISDNLLKMSAREKTVAIRYAIEEYGFKVYGEVGKKEGKLTDDEAITDIGVCLDAGCDAVYLEAAEMYEHGQKARVALINRISETYPMDKLIFELPVVINPGSSHSAKIMAADQLVVTFGTEVNFANIEHYELLVIELFRLGMGGSTKHPDGAYKRAGF